MTEPDETLEEGHPSTPLTVQPAGGRSIRRLLVTVGMSAALVGLPGVAIAGQAGAPSTARNAGSMKRT